MNKLSYGYDAKELGLEVTGYSGINEVLCKCPNPEHSDSNPSASFNIENGLLYCFSCGYSVNAYQLAKQAGVALERKPIKYVKPDSEQLWKEFYKLPQATGNKYLRSRDVGDMTVGVFDIRQSNKGIVFLFRDYKSNLVGCQLRQYDKKPKYLTFGERVLFDLTKLPLYNPSKPLYLTEGVFGMIRGYQSGFQTLATIGAMIKESTLEPILNWSKVYGVFDNDLAGSIAAVRLLKFVPQAKIVLGATADEMSYEQWKDLHNSYLTTSNILDIINLSKEPDKLRKYV